MSRDDGDGTTKRAMSRKGHIMLGNNVGTWGGECPNINAMIEL